MRSSRLTCTIIGAWLLSACMVYDESLLTAVPATGGATGGTPQAGGTGGDLLPTGGTGGVIFPTGGTGGDIFPAGGTGGVILPTGGTGGTGPIASEIRWGFDSTLEGWALHYSVPDPLESASAAAWDGTVGAPGASAILHVPFSAIDQKVQFSVQPSPALDLRGKTLTAQVILDSGLTSDAVNPGGVKLFVKSGAAWVYAATAWRNFQAGAGWITLSMAVDTPDYVDPAGTHDPSQIVEIGVEVATGSATSTFQSATLHVDSVSY
jgi:hypothetical protein